MPTSTHYVGTVPTQSSDFLRLFRHALFQIGDFLFAVAVAGSAIYVMHLAHRFQIGFVASMVVGMAAGMVLQVVASFAVAPLLGSIESMVPAMATGMIAPMAVCARALVGCHLTGKETAVAAIVTAIIVQFLMWTYSRLCRFRLAGDPRVNRW
jgi:hypothetical protein